jgi:hypothetical protein
VRGCRADGISTGYIVLPGSERHDGKLYAVVCDAPIAELPDWLRDRVTKRGGAAGVRTHDTEQVREYMKAHGGRADQHPLAGAMLDQAKGRLAAMAPNTGRNSALNAAAYHLAQYVPHHLAENDVFAALMAAAEECGLCADDGEDATATTVCSGLNGGRDNLPPVFFESMAIDIQSPAEFALAQTEANAIPVPGLFSASAARWRSIEPEPARFVIDKMPRVEP